MYSICKKKIYLKPFPLKIIKTSFNVLELTITLTKHPKNHTTSLRHGLDKRHTFSCRASLDW